MKNFFKIYLFLIFIIKSKLDSFYFFRYSTVFKKNPICYLSSILFYNFLSSRYESICIHLVKSNYTANNWKLIQSKIGMNERAIEKGKENFHLNFSRDSIMEWWKVNFLAWIEKKYSRNFLRLGHHWVSGLCHTFKHYRYLCAIQRINDSLRKAAIITLEQKVEYHNIFHDGFLILFQGLN